MAALWRCLPHLIKNAGLKLIQQIRALYCDACSTCVLCFFPPDIKFGKPVARWQSGYAAACKAVDAGSIPTLASISSFTILPGLA